ncbi:unnamed protein product [Choristocarpus tenellus]
MNSKAGATPVGGAIVQDLAPPGGYPPIKIARNLPNRGPPGWAMFGGVACFMAYGYYLVGQGNQKRRADKQEKRQARISILPLLQVM